MNIAPDISSLYPEISLALFGVLTLAVDLILKKKDKLPVALTAFVGFLATGYLVIDRWTLEVLAMKETANFTPFINLFDIFILSAALLTIFISVHYLKRENFNYGEYYGLMFFVVLGMFIMVSAVDLLVFFLGLELMSIALYILVGLFRTRKYSNEAAIKYLIMGAFATGFLLYGIALIYGVTGTTSLPKILSVFWSDASLASSPLLMLGVLLLIVGFSFKLAFVPFHMWTPDVYQGAPTPLTAFMSVAVKAAAFAAFLFVFVTFNMPDSNWHYLLHVLAVFTMTFGNIAAIRQKNIKRMLAYSSIAHAGYILVGFTAISNPYLSKTVFSSIYFYLVGYMLMNFGAFTVAMLVAGKEDLNYSIDNYKGLSSRKPLLAGLMAVFMFSLIGIPPLVGFMAKFQIFYAAVKADFIVLTIIAVLNSVVAVYYYLRIVVYMYMNEPVGNDPEFILPKHIMALLIILALGIIIIGMFPSLIQNVIAPYWPG